MNANSLPHIEHKVKLHLDKINRHLSSLPELPDNVELEVQRSLYKFNETARATVDEFIKHLNKLSRDFRDCLLHIKPKFILKDKSDIPILEISDGESDAESVATTHTTPSKRRNMAPPVTPAKRHRGATPLVNSGSFVKPEDSDGNHTPIRARPLQAELPPPFTPFGKVGGGFRTLRQVAEEIESKTTAGMPTLIPQEVYEDLALEAVRPWDRPLDAYLKEAMNNLQKELYAALATSFDALKKRIVFQEAKKHLAKFLQSHHAKAREEFLRMHQKEKRRLVTFNDDAFERYNEDEKKLLVRFRHKMRMETRGLIAVRPLENWDSMSEAKQREEDKRRADELLKIGKDQFEREIEVVAYIRGYYRLAALRFSENVSQGVLCQLIPDIKDELSLYLNREMGLLPGAARAVYERLMEEDPEVASKRETLKREKDKFVKALASIEALNAGASDTDEMGSFSLRDEIMIDDATTIADVGV
jgi:hypothetical protein